MLAHREILEELRTRNNVQIHVASAGAGAGLAGILWALPGSSAYFSGATFLNAKAETEEFLGFTPDSFCSPEAALDLAMAAYMKAYVPGVSHIHGTAHAPVGLGLSASVATSEVHRGAHRVHAAVVTREYVLSLDAELEKGSGEDIRRGDGICADSIGMSLLKCALMNGSGPISDKSAEARAQFFKRSFFSGGNRYQKGAVLTDKPLAIYPGAFNPLHWGHTGCQSAVQAATGYRVVFTTTANPPHKEALSLTQMLERTKQMQGHEFLMTENDALYIDKARQFPGAGIVLGMDAALRMLDPKWGPDPIELLKEFDKLGTRFYLFDRKIDGELVSFRDLLPLLPPDGLYDHLFCPQHRCFDISSTELRQK